MQKQSQYFSATCTGLRKIRVLLALHVEHGRNNFVGVYCYLGLLPAVQSKRWLDPWAVAVDTHTHTHHTHSHTHTHPHTHTHSGNTNWHNWLAVVPEFPAVRLGGEFGKT